MTDVGAIANFSAADKSALLNFKQKVTGKTANDGRKNVEIMVPVKCLSNFWRTLAMYLINCEINLILAWSEKFVLSNYKKAITFAITDTKLDVPVATLSTQDNEKLLQQLKSGFKRTINWNKYRSKVSIQGPNFLIDPSF